MAIGIPLTFLMLLGVGLINLYEAVYHVSVKEIFAPYKQAFIEDVSDPSRGAFYFMAFFVIVCVVVFMSWSYERRDE